MTGASATAQKLQTGRHEQPGWRTELQAAKNTLHAAQTPHPSRQAARPVVIGGCDDGDEFTEPLVTKAAFEAAWGGCHRSGWRSVLVALPYSADMLCDLQVLMFTNLKSLECANDGFNLHLGLYDKPYQNDMDARKTKKSGRGVLAGSGAAGCARLRRRPFGCASRSVPCCCPCPWSGTSVCRPCACCCRRPQWRCCACSARRWARSGAAPPGAAALPSVWCGVRRVCAADVVCRVWLILLVRAWRLPARQGLGAVGVL